MEGQLKLSTATNVTIKVVDAASPPAGITGLSAGLTIYATKAGGTPGAITPTVTELDATHAKGLYKLALTAAHLNTLGEFELSITGAGAEQLDIKWQVVSALPTEIQAAIAAVLAQSPVTVVARETVTNYPVEVIYANDYTGAGVITFTNPSGNWEDLTAATFVLVDQDDKTGRTTNLGGTFAATQPTPGTAQVVSWSIPKATFTAPRRVNYILECTLSTTRVFPAVTGVLTIK